MPDLPDATALDERFGQLSTQYSQRRDAAQAKVVRWQWYNWPGLDPRPLHFERDRLKPGRPVSDRPPLDINHLRIGFDADDRPVIQIEYSGFLGGRPYYNTFWDYSQPDVVEETHFQVDDGAIYLHEHRYVEGLIRSTTAVARGGASYETFAYAGDRVTLIDWYHAQLTQKPGRRLHPFAPYVTLAAEWDDQGLVRLEKRWQKANEVVYERPPAGFTIEEAGQSVHGVLVQAVRDTVSGLAVAEPAYCVALGYTSDPLEFLVYVGLDAHRQDASDPYEIWGPADLDGEEPVDLAVMADTVRLLQQELALLNADNLDDAPGTAGARELLCAVAAELNTMDWGHILPVTEDFLVYPTDLELADLEANLRSCLPPDRFAWIRRSLPDNSESDDQGGSRRPR
jgi:hypothetical protein